MVCVYLPYLAMNHRQQNYFLLAASYFFYGFWDWRFLSLIMFSTVVDYFCGLAIHHAKNLTKRRRYLLLSVVTNLGMLGIFKYLGFFVESTVDLFNLLGYQPNITMLNIILPVGISFYTFQTMSYTIDIYRKEMKPTRNFFDFALFVSFFPQLVAGPIERAKSLLPQIQSPRVVTYEQVSRGSFLILWGLFKKIVIADGVAGAVESVYGMSSAEPTSMDITLATYLFAIQIYCDFSGYSDVARGTAKLLGFELITNFNLPFFASNPKENWDRWHISLANWLRDYLYMPLITRGFRRGEWYIQSVVMVTVFLSGVWHGGAWNFVLWGLFQGLLMSGNRFWKVVWAKLSKGRIKKKVKRKRKLSQSPPLTPLRLLKIFLYFQINAYGRMLFRATSLTQVMSFTTIIFLAFTFHTSVNFSMPIATVVGIILLFSLETYQYVTDDPHFYRKWPIPIRTGLYAVLFFLLMAGTSNATQTFIYFAF